MAADPLVHLTDSVSSGIKGDAVLGPPHGPPEAVLGVRVTWIAWDSSFRGSGLRIGDLIAAVDGEPLAPLLLPGKFQTLIGQANESYGWEKKGGRPDQPLQLTVLRDGETVEISGTLLPERIYRTADGQYALAPGGPPRLVNDGFSEAWMGWYEKLVWKLSQILDGLWYRGTLNTRKELAELAGQNARLDFLAQRYPGPFAETARADWNAAMESLRGKRLEQIDLGYRELGAKRLETVKEEADHAYEAFRKELAAEMISPFPAPPIDDVDKVAGKVVDLPWIGQRQIINDLGRTYAVAESSGEYYFVQLSASPEFLRFYDTMSRFQTQIAPRLAERYQFVGTIQESPRMITYRDRAVTGLTLQIIAVRAGEQGELFVDLRKTGADGKTPFAGEAAVSRFEAPALNDDAGPQEVLEAMVRAVKLADEAAWRRLFADWRVNLYDDGRVLFEAASRPHDATFHSGWEDARKLITGEVYDARVDQVGPIRRIVEANPQAGVPAIDQAVAWIDHYGLFEGEYRSFNRFDVHRRWVLQRVNDGPWRIAEVQGL
jgi:hypothetical protein